MFFLRDVLSGFLMLSYRCLGDETRAYRVLVVGGVVLHTPRMRSVTFLVDERLVAAVEELAAADRRKRSDLIRLALEEFVASRGVPVVPVRSEPAALSSTPEYVVHSAPAGAGKSALVPAGWDVPTPDPLDDIA